jgi:hypothetical protein
VKVWKKYAMGKNTAGIIDGPATVPSLILSKYLAKVVGKGYFHACFGLVKKRVGVAVA